MLKKWLVKAHLNQVGAATSSLISVIVVMAIALIVVGIGIAIGGPTMLTGFETMRTNAAIGNYTSLSTIVTSGPTLILLGFIIAIAVVGFLGIKVARAGKE